MRISDWSSDVCSSDLHRSLQRIAARLLYVADEEEDGLIEVDNVAAGTGRAARMRFWIVSLFFVLFSLMALIALLVWGIAIANGDDLGPRANERSEEHTSELQSLMRISYAVFCLKKKTEYHDIIT